MVVKLQQLATTLQFMGIFKSVSRTFMGSSSWLLLRLSIFCLVFAAESGSRKLGVSATDFMFINSCSYEVAVGLQQNANLASLGGGGFLLAVGLTNTVTAPAGWSGRFWGRTGCNFNPNGLGKCATGDCQGFLECNGVGGDTPATLVQVVLGNASPDQYDVSLVNGYNLPLQIAPNPGGTGSCGTAGCISNLNMNCPPALQVASNGVVVACKSACDALTQPQYCCTGYYNSPATCPPTPYSADFKSACPMAVTYAYDSVNSSFTCSGASYTITFCPAGSSGAGAPAVSPAPGSNVHSPPAPPGSENPPPRPQLEPSGPAESPMSEGGVESGATALLNLSPALWCFLLFFSLATLATGQLVNCL